MEASTPQGVSIIVVSYETRDLTLECLASVFEETRETTFEVLVVDNASSDGSARAVEEHFPHVRLFAQTKNLGFGAGVNLAADRARGEYLLLLNPDTRILDQAIDRLVAFARENPDAGIYGGLTQYADGTINASSCWNRPTLWSSLCQGLGLTALLGDSALFNPEPVRLDGGSGPIRVDIVSGGFLLIRRNLWDALSGFDPVFFMYGEDFDLALRAGKLGAKPIITRDARIIHHGGASERDDGDRLVRLLKSKAQLFDRHWSPLAAWLGKRTLLFWAFSRWAGYRIVSLVRRNAVRLAATWRHVWIRRREFLRPE